MVRARVPVDAPIAAPSRTGLVASAPRVDEADNRWEAGFEYLSECIDPGNHGTGDPCGDDQTKGGTDNKVRTIFDPFYIWASVKCTAGDRGTDWEARGRRALEVVTPFEIEAEFWTGAQAGEAGFTENRYLAHPTDADVLSNGPLDPLEALACLEYGIGRCPSSSEGWIHAPRNLVTIWDGMNVLERQGNRQVTQQGNVVVAGAGYDGSGPGGDPAVDGSVWAYATGPVQVRYSEAIILGDDIAERIARSLNDLEVIAERVAAATWDGCCHFAIQVDAPFCDVGGQGY